VRAKIAEASYKAHLENLANKECLRQDENLDLGIINNDQREWNKPADTKHSREQNKTGRY
jgi:hypothetical protein